jgi:hypothetical protein
MNPVGHQPRYYAEEFQPEPSRAHAVFCAAVLAVCLLGIGAWIGTYIGESLCREKLVAKALQPRPVCSYPARANYIVPIHECNRVCRANCSSARLGAGL